MEIMTAAEIAKAAGGEIKCGAENVTVSSVAVDTRKIKKDGLFVAMKGKRTDGHLFIDKAFENGASAVIIENDMPYVGGGTIIKTASSLRALQALAANYRSRFDIPVVAVTGSVGKTTTKEICYSVLSARYKTLKNEGNLNSDIGMPLTVFNLDKSYTAAVFEMGMSSAGEISVMTHIARPYVAIITNIGISHIERLGTRENILKAKLEIEQGLLSDGVMLLNGDDDKLYNYKDKLTHQTYFYGIENKKCDFYAEDIESGSRNTNFTVVSSYGEFGAKINAIGLHNVYNALAAASAGLLLGLSFNEIAEGLLFFRNADMRQNIYEKNGITIIEDCYNASPDSMNAALSVLKQIKGKRKIAVLSDMLELGEQAEAMHIKAGEKTAESADFLICYGSFAKSYIKGADRKGMNSDNAIICCDAKEAAEKLSELTIKGDALLFKGSRGMKAEECIKEFLERWINK